MSAAARDFLARTGLAAADERAAWTPLAGGVSSDLWRVDLPGRSLCVKAALPKLRVAADWRAPVSRNAFEWAYLRFAGEHCPGSVPALLARDDTAGLFAMEFLPPERFPVWKARLLRGYVDVETARAVGDLLGRLHAASAGDAELAAGFASDDNFRALRIEPYLMATAAVHEDLRDVLGELAARTAETRLALVHGDVSPKNILVGPDGPVLLDAECAWYGDPAFDVAFCVHHLLLKSVLRPDRRPALVAAASALTAAHAARVGWEPVATLQARMAALVPALLLARVDGKSPVEYLTRERDRDLVRAAARALLRSPAGGTAELCDRFVSYANDSNDLGSEDLP